jgi:hypothetical protein
MNNPIRSILPATSSLVPQRLLPISLMSLGLATLSLSCTQPGYRNEVYPGQQGQYVIKQVPVAPAPESASAAQPASPTNAPANNTPTNSPAPMANAASAPQPMDSDPETSVSTVQSLWPKLSPANRAAVVDLTRHLASQ